MGEKLVATLTMTNDIHFPRSYFNNNKISRLHHFGLWYAYMESHLFWSIGLEPTLLFPCLGYYLIIEKNEQLPNANSN